MYCALVNPIKHDVCIAGEPFHNITTLLKPLLDAQKKRFYIMCKHVCPRPRQQLCVGKIAFMNNSMLTLHNRNLLNWLGILSSYDNLNILTIKR